MVLTHGCKDLAQWTVVHARMFLPRVCSARCQMLMYRQSNPSVNAILDAGTDMQTSYGIAKISRLLLSANQMVVNGHQVIFGKDESYIQLAKSHKSIPLRAKEELYMFDMWVKVPLDLASTSPLVR